jgi:hypothetical protein
LTITKSGFDHGLMGGEAVFGSSEAFVAKDRKRQDRILNGRFGKSLLRFFIFELLLGRNFERVMINERNKDVEWTWIL